MTPTADGWRRTRLAIWLGTILMGLLIPLKIVSLGYLPLDDALRHVAKVFSGRTWPEIVVLREGFGGDQHPGWHALLGAVHELLGWGSDALLAFSICGLFFLFLGALLWRRKRPEGVLIILCLVALVATMTFNRLLLGRPYIFVMAAVVVTLQLWSDELTTGWRRGLVTVLLLGTAVWMHGASWTLFSIVIAAFALSGEGRKSVSLAGCWMAGVLLGASLTGHPIAYLTETLRHLFLSFEGPVLQRMLVSEFQPSSGDLELMVLVGGLLVWREARGKRAWEAVVNPVFVLAMLGWLLGLQVSRFWTDWGFPALMLWFVRELDDVLTSHQDAPPVLMPILAVLAAAGVFIAATRDIGARWSRSLKVEFLTPETPGITGWLPEKGGLIYTADMIAFYRTFYKNPTADWRYVLGFEPGIMPPDDLEILRNIQWNDYADSSYEPWVKKMRPADRLIIMTGPAKCPQLKGLEWCYAIHDTWIGRLPRPK